MSAPSQTTEIAAPVATATQFVPALRNAAAAGLVAFGLSFPDHQLPRRIEHQ